MNEPEAHETESIRVPSGWDADPSTAAAADRTANIRPPVSRAVRGVVIAVVIAVVLAVAVKGRGASPFRRELHLLVALVALTVTMAAVLAAHELGHALGGRIAGWHLRSLVVGPVRLVRRNQRLVIWWHRMYSLYGGAVLLSPSDWEDPAVH